MQTEKASTEATNLARCVALEGNWYHLPVKQTFFVTF